MWTIAAPDAYPNDQLLGCPACGFEYTHVETVIASTRKGEGGEQTHIRVDRDGAVTVVPDAPEGRFVGSGYRHRLSLIGSCENGHEFALVLTQHKGWTYFEAVPFEAETVASSNVLS